MINNTEYDKINKTEEFMTAKEMAEALKLNLVTIHREIKRGNLKALHIGGRKRINLKEFNRYVEQNSTGA